MQSIKYVTTNSGKFQEAQLILAPHHLLQHNLDIEEIQGSSTAIIKAKAKAILQQTDAPFIVEDISFSIDALHGFPGPYVKDFLHNVGKPKYLAELVNKLSSNRCTSTCHVAYYSLENKLHYYSGHLHGQIVAPKGHLAHGKISFNSVFLPDGHNKTMGELTMDECAVISHRAQALKQVLPALERL